MREFSTPTSLPAPSGNLSDDVVRNALEAPGAAVLSRPGRAGAGRAGSTWHDVTAAEFLAEVSAVAKGLVAAGVEVGDRVALMSRTRYEWTLVDYAVWFAGAVSVPIYDSSSAEQVAFILGDSGACAVVAEGPDHLARITAHRGDLPALHHVWTLDDNAISVLTRLGDDIDDDELERRRTAAAPEDLATIIYTSGTTGAPKGCMLTHANFMAELDAVLHDLGDLFEAEDASTLLFLPLPHVFARLIQVGCVRARVRLGHSHDVGTLVPRLQEFRPTFVLAVPRVFEKMFNTASQRATADGRGALFQRAAEAAIAWSRAQDPPRDAGEGGRWRGRNRGRASVRARARHALYDRLVYARLRESLGGACAYAVSGGAPLGERLGHFYRGVGVIVLEGYGLSETTAALSVNVPDGQKIGTVGRPLLGTAVRVADDGELLVRGRQVFAGYWNQPGATADVISDGWLHTGDLGEVDDEGFVRITGRKKEILVTAGGKNVAPTVLEDRLRAHPLVSQALVVGDGQPFVAALVTIDDEAFAPWAAANGVPRSVASAVDAPALVAAVQEAVDEANTAVSKAESIRRFRILAHDWTEEAGHLTPSLKLRRNVVVRQFKDEIAALFV